MHMVKLNSTHGPRPALHTLAKSISRPMTTSAKTPRKEGDISSVFVSLSGKEQSPLPQGFARQKKRLIAGREDQVKKSWDRLLYGLREEVRTIERRGSDIIPSIDFQDILAAPRSFQDELRKRGVAIIRGVIPEVEARTYKEDIEKYVRENPQTKGMFKLFCASSHRVTLMSCSIPTS